MKTLSPQKTKELLELKPTKIAQYINQLGQKVTILEHPIYGSDSSLLALIEGVMAVTGFYDCDDFRSNTGLITEYMPCLVDGKIDCALNLLPYDMV